MPATQDALRQGQSAFKDVFISYGRADSKAFAQDLSQRLRSAGFTAWFDFSDIPLATDFQQRIDDGIEKSHSFLYIISPSSVKSPYCHKELELALQYNKRIIPLMHVEELAYETWHQRHPHRSAAEWQAVVAAGSHLSANHLDATVRKLHWAKFRPGIDDFQQSFQELLELLRQRQDYVQQHTQLLVQALHWERQHRQSKYLLVGAERQAAETWLKSRPNDPLCPSPTPLHCEFITESIKNAENLMTQVFLCHSDCDRNHAETIRQSLVRHGITVWNYRTDIQASQDYTQTITRGIEGADTVIFILSPHSAQSAYCQRELAQAQALHKRIIPVLAAAVEPEWVPPSLRVLQHIDLTDNQIAEDYQADESELLHQLNCDSTYYREHKTWLTQGLKWQRQQHNPALLLRGYNLDRAETWLKTARTHAHPPTELHQRFIAASLQQPPSLSLDAFISYSRVDSDFARRLNEALQLQGKRTWFDQESIAKGADFQQEIYRGIESCDVFLFILSPESVSSEFCADEVDYAKRLNKRIVTVLYRPVEPSTLHPVLKALQWLDFHDPDGDFAHTFQHLLRTLNTDREHVETHTRLLGRALEWDRSQRDESLLLRGTKLRTAEAWLADSQELDPQPTPLQREYLRASHARQKAQSAAERKLKRGALLGGIAAAVGVAVAAGAGWFTQAQIANARAVQRVTDIEQSASRALLQFERDETGAMITAMQAGQGLQELMDAEDSRDGGPRLAEYPTRAPVNALSQLLKQSTSREILPNQDGVWQARWSPDGKVLASVGNDDSIKLLTPAGELVADLGDQHGVNGISWSPDGRVLAVGKEAGSVELRQPTGELITSFETQQVGVWSLSWSPDGQTLATGSFDGSLKLWSPAGEAVTAIEARQNGVWSLSWSPDGQTLASGGDDGSLKLWSRTGEALASIDAHEKYIRRVSWHPDGQTIATGSFDGTVKLWSAAGEPVSTLLEEQGWVEVSWSPDGQVLATGGTGSGAKLWSVSGELLKTFSTRQIAINSLDWSPNGQTLAIGGFDGSIKLSARDTAGVTTLQTQQGWSNNVSWSPAGQVLATGGQNGSVKFWTAAGELIEHFEAHDGTITEVSWSPDGQTLATTSFDGSVRLWNQSGQKIDTAYAYSGDIWSVSWSPDSQLLAIAKGDGTVELWSSTAEETITLKGHGDIVADVSWSPDGQMLATGSYDGSVHLWTRTGEPLETFAGYGGEVYETSWSPDGQTLAMGGGEGNIKLWNLSGEVLTLDASQSFVTSILWSLEGQTLLTGGSDGSVVLWTASGEQVATLDVRQASELDLSWSPDGQTLAIGGDDGIVELWSANRLTAQLDQLLAAGCDWLSSYLVGDVKALEALTACHTPELLAAAAPLLVAEGEALAEKGAMAAAVETLQTAKAWDPTLGFDPVALAHKVRAALPEAEALLAAQHWLLLHQHLLAEQPVQALEQFQRAVALNPPEYWRMSDATLEWICRAGSLQNQAKQVLDACDEGMSWGGDFTLYEARGIARALTGDTAGAAEDFQAFIEAVEAAPEPVDATYMQRRRDWLAELQAGHQPFTASELNFLIEEERTP